MKYILEAQNLTKEFDDLIAVNNISMSLFEGEIVGLLGPNGSGKTTTIKMILGLIKPTKGKIVINGYDLHENFCKAIANIGSIVETPNFYPYLSGYENLMISFRMYSNSNITRLNELIEIVGLKDRIHDPVKKYSLGMKQRLGICRALIGGPKILFLDEPINGLDPEGITEFREFISKLATIEKVTILISSHILSEIEKVCNRVIIINKGIIKGIVNINNHECKKLYRLKTTEASEALNLLGINTDVKVVSHSGNYIDIEIINIKINEINSFLVKNDIKIESIFPINDSLENSYIAVLNGNGVEIDV